MSEATRHGASSNAPGVEESRDAILPWRFLVAPGLTVLAAWYAGLAFGAVVHETGHALAAKLTGGVVQGIAIGLGGTGGTTYTSNPFIETSRYAGTFVFAAGTSMELLAGSLVVGAWLLSRRVRGSPLLSCWIGCLLGRTPAGILYSAVVGGERAVTDYRVVTEDLGWTSNGARGLTIMLVGAYCVLLGLWYFRSILAGIEIHLRIDSLRSKTAILIAIAWLPPILVGTGMATVCPRPSAVLSCVLFGGLLALVPATLALRAWRRTDTGAELPTGSPIPVRRDLAVATACAVFAVLLTLGVGRAFDPTSVPTREWIAASAERSPNDARALRLAAFWSTQIHDGDGATKYLERARRVAPDDAGTLFDLGRRYRLTGRFEEAVLLLTRAESLRPDLEAIPADLASTYERLRRPRVAAAAWRRSAEDSRRRSPSSESVERYVRMVTDRAERLETFAAHEGDKSFPQLDPAPAETSSGSDAGESRK
ncbi:MAG: M50 family metallopeptidase [Acidobacteriia bacterium]|nr:M50 family metallopeptidase [Terriglobia bacterium]